MIWDKLVVENFLSIGRIEIDLNNQGLVLIEGKNESDETFETNGAGKSGAISESITWVLYDKTAKGIKGDEVVNNKVKKNTMVSLTGRQGDDTYRIERYRKHKVHKNKVLLFRNDVEITGKSTDDTTKEIENIVGVSYLTFTNSVMFAQSQGLGAFASLTDSKKKEILDSLLNLDIYSKSQEIAKRKVKEQQDLIVAKEREIEKKNWDLEQVDKLEKQEHQNYESTKNMIKQENDNMAIAIKDLRDFPAKYFGHVEQARDNIKVLQEKMEQVSNIDMATEEDEFNTAHRSLNELENQERMLVHNKSQLVAQYKKLEFTDNCPVCGSEMDNSHKIAEQENIKNELRTVMISLQQLENTKQPYIDAVNEARERYDAKLDEQKQVLQLQRTISENIKKNEEYITKYELGLRQRKDKLESIKTTIQKLQNVPEPSSRESDRESIRRDITRLKEELLALELEKKEYEDVVKVYSNDGVKSHVLDLITPTLNESGNKFLKQLAGDNMELIFDTKTLKKDNTYSDKFDVKVINTVGGDSYKHASGGERKRVDLSISLALQDLILKSTNILVYDEVFDALDAVGIENTLKLLQERVKVFGSIFVITQNPHLKALFEKVITITKGKDGISTIKRTDK
ncbi:exonuclease subunit 2 [Bacillus phage vB_BceH_LY2]|nr:exonuclease subunit 2 [Bacillus phage vB_BceH_LY2]